MPLIDSKGEKVNVIDYFGSPITATTGVLRDKLFSYISLGKYPNLMFLLLTKRPSNINKYIPESWKLTPPKNVMFGTSPVNQETANKLILQLLEVNGKRFLSVEPQLDSINIQGFLFNGGIDWVIQGGESGHHKRPFNLDWAYYLKQQCEATNTPYFFKQIDKVQPIPQDLLNRQFPSMDVGAFH
jgi:protein gp37